MTQICIVSPKCTSTSAKELARVLYVPYIRLIDWDRNSDLKVINWGCSGLQGDIIINRPQFIRKSINKLTTFELLHYYIDMPSMTLSKKVALLWIQEGVVIRNKIDGSQSEGVTITGDVKVLEETEAIFYTQYIHHVKEIRINCYKDKVVSVYDKIDEGNGTFDFKYIKNAEKEIPDEIQKWLDIIYGRIGLEIYGLDVLITEEGKYYLLEVNSAPILFPITCSRIANLIKKDYFNV